MPSHTSTALVLQAEGEPMGIPGVHVIAKVTKDMTGGAYSVFVNRATGGDGVPMHTHLHDEETMIVVRGRILCRLDADRFVAQQGDVVHLPAGVPHGWRPEGEEEVELIVLFSLTPDSDYERMFRVLSRLDLEEDPASATAIVAANGMNVPLPPEFV